MFARTYIIISNSSFSLPLFLLLFLLLLEFDESFRTVRKTRIRLISTSSFLPIMVIIMVGGGVSFLGLELIAFSFPFLNYYILGFFLGGYRVNIIIKEGPIIVTIEKGFIIVRV